MCSTRTRVRRLFTEEHTRVACHTHEVVKNEIINRKVSKNKHPEIRTVQEIEQD